MIDYEVVDKKGRFVVSLSVSNDGVLYLKNIQVETRYRDRGLAKRIIYSLWVISKFLDYNYMIVNIISPIIENIVKKYYVYEILETRSDILTIKISGVKQAHYREGILVVFFTLKLWNGLQSK